MRPGISWLDLKLGIRMMARYPGLTVVGLLAMIVAIGVSAAWFEFTKDMFDPALPLEDGGRLVAISNWDAEAAAREPRSLHDFTTWRAEVRSIEELGAASGVRYTVTTEDGRSATVPGVRMTATGFRVARVAPLFGRTLLGEDEQPGAPPVVVIGHDLWQRLFDGGRDVLGQTLQLGDSTSTIVGVMPQGFGFPANQEVWTPLQVSPLQYARRDGPAIRVFGRLARGVSLEEAQTELTRLGEQAAAAFPESNRQLRPRVERYLQSYVNGSTIIRSAMNVPFLLLLIVISTNVATLVFARTATRRRELVTRSALGASRGRLVLQLFAEALVVTSIAAVIGLSLAAWGLETGMTLFWAIQESRPPFWAQNALSLSTVIYSGLLALLSAALVGVIPALKATGRDLRSGLSQVGASSSRLRFGATSTAVIILQVALCVVFLPIALARGFDALGNRLEQIDFPADQYLSGRLTAQLEPSPGTTVDQPGTLTGSAQLQDEVRRRIANEPGVTAVTYASRLPGMNHLYEAIRVEDAVISPNSAIQDAARSLSVDLEFFDALGASIVSGRGFRPSDLESEIGVAIVDEAFVRQILQGRNAVGRGLRYPGRPAGDGDRRYEIVGVVEDLAMNAYGPGGYAAPPPRLPATSPRGGAAPRAVHQLLTA